MERYERIQPGFADRLIRLAEDEAVHRRGIEKSTASAQIEDARSYRWEVLRGQFFALSIGIVAILSGTYAATHGAQWTGSLIGGGGVVGLVTAFIAGRRQPK